MAKSADRIGSIIPGVLKQLGLEGRIEEEKLKRQWASVAGEAIAKVSRPVRVRDGVLYVEVESGAWVQELSFRRRQFVELIGDRYRAIGLKDIRFELKRGDRRG